MTARKNIDPSPTCIWTDAGIIRDHLCDRCFACETCPLDAALKKASRISDGEADELTFETIAVGIPEGVSSIPSTVVQPFLRLTICNECRYNNTHAWMRRGVGSTYWCGIDSFGASLLPKNASIISVARNVHVQEGEPYAWVYADEFVVPLPVPVSGIVTERKHQGAVTASMIAEQPYQTGTLVALIPDAQAVKLSRTHSAIEQASHLRHDARRLLATMTRSARRHEIEAGVCLNDGGLPVTNLREFLGEKSYSSLVRSFLCGE